MGLIVKLRLILNRWFFTTGGFPNEMKQHGDFPQQVLRGLVVLWGFFGAQKPPKLSPGNPSQGLLALVLWMKQQEDVLWIFESKKSSLPETNSKSTCKWMFGIQAFPIGMAYFQGRTVSFRECTLKCLSHLTFWWYSSWLPSCLFCWGSDDFWLYKHDQFV